MMKFSNFSGIFATVFVTTTIILLASCSQDDDYYESDMYTLAEMGTRSGGGDPGGEPTPPVPYFGNPVQAGGDTIKFNVEMQEMELFIQWSRGYTGISSPVSQIAITPHYWDTLACHDFPYPDNLRYRVSDYIGSTGQWVDPNNKMRIRVEYFKDTIEVRRVSEYTSDTFYYSKRKNFFYEYTPTCIPDSLLQPL